MCKDVEMCEEQRSVHFAEKVVLNRAVAGDELVRWAEAAWKGMLWPEHGRPCVSGSGVYMLAKGRGVLPKRVT